MTRIFKAEKVVRDPTPIITPDAPQLLDESPAKEISSLKFGHAQIVNTLKRVIHAANSSATIGLFGGWGSGKSSIVENLKQTFIESRVPVIIFDVWKHDGDALRRTFLKSLDLQLSAAPYGEPFVERLHILNPQVFNAVKESSEKVVVKTKRILLNLFALFALSFVVIGGFLFCCFLLESFTRFALLKWITENNMVSAAGLLLSTALTGGMAFKYIDNFIKVEKTEEQKEKLQDPHEFEKEFERLVANLRREIKTLVVVFDNLDRISGEHVLQVISTIKTFLDIRAAETDRKVVFLIPCDVNAIKMHIRLSLNNDDPDYMDEFLRKFFNTSIWIPEFYENELENFATEKLKSTLVKELDDDQLAWLVIRAFHKNPRQIVQFVNILLANFLLLKEYSENGAFTANNFHEKNLLQLAKFLILKMCFPKIIDHFLYRGIYDLSDKVVNYELSHRDTGQPDYQAFRDMLEKTREIRIVSLEPFFKFRLSQDEQKIPEINSIMQQIIYGDTKAELTEAAIYALDKPALSNAIRNRFKSTSNMPMRLAILKGTLMFAQSYEIVYLPKLYKDLLDFVVDLESDSLSILDAELLATGLLLKIKPFPSEDIRRVIDVYMKTFDDISITADEGSLLKVAGMFISLKDHFSMKQLSALSLNLARRYEDVPLIAQILKDRQAQQKFIDEKFITHLIEQLNVTSDGKLKLIFTYLPDLLVTDQNFSQIISALVQRINRMFSTASSDESLTAELIQLVTPIFESWLPRTSVEIASVLSELIATLQGTSYPVRYLSLILELNAQPEIADAVQAYFQTLIRSAQIDDLTQLIEKTDINEVIQEESMQSLFERVILFDPAGALLLPELKGSNPYLFQKHLLDNGYYELLSDSPTVANEMSQDERSSLLTGMIDKVIEGHQTLPLSSVQSLLDLISSPASNADWGNSVKLTEMTFALLERQSGSELFNKGLIFLKALFENSNEEFRSHIGGRLIGLASGNSLYNVKGIYELSFNFFEALKKEDQDRLRDLIYLTLFHHMSGNATDLEVALFATESDVTFDFHTCETYFTDFLNTAQTYIPNGSSSYYKKLIQNIIPKLKKYQTKAFKEIKQQLKILSEID